MTVDWWSTQPAKGSETPTPEPFNTPSAPALPSVPSAAPEPVREEGDEESSSRTRGMTVKVVGGAAGALVAGALMLNVFSGGDGGEGQGPSATASAEQGEGLPPAGDGVLGDDLPAAGDGSERPQRENAPAQRTERTPGGVALAASPSGKGRIGVVMKISLHNDTDKPLTVMASLVQGDGRPGVVGEGTLAPGSRVVEPGRAAEGTIEFSASTAPHQVALVDLSGDIVATNTEDRQ